MKTYRKPLSRVYPAYHPKAGQPTNFVEQFYNSVGIDYNYNRSWVRMLNDINKKEVDDLQRLAGFIFRGVKFHYTGKKGHTIRKGAKVKVGDFIQFYVWSDKPYRSKQIVIAPPVEVKKVWDFEIKINAGGGVNLYVNDKFLHYETSWGLEWDKETLLKVNNLALNDGLTYKDFKDWFGGFKKPFKGQIICWDESIDYES